MFGGQLEIASGCGEALRESTSRWGPGLSSPVHGVCPSRFPSMLKSASGSENTLSCCTPLFIS